MGRQGRSILRTHPVYRKCGNKRALHVSSSETSIEMENGRLQSKTAYGRGTVPRFAVQGMHRSAETCSCLTENFGLLDCLCERSRYRGIVPTSRFSYLPPAMPGHFALVMACALALAGCAGSVPRTGPASALAGDQGTPATANPLETYWWRDAGDPVLAKLIETGLVQDRDLDCQALALNKASERAQAHKRRITTQIGQLFDTRGTDVNTATIAARSYRYATDRSDRAARIAIAYIETRRLQEILAARTAAQGVYGDNAEIAAFREEAGLVSGLDSDLARTMVSISNDNIKTAHARYIESRDALALLVGLSGDALQTILSETGSVPDFGAAPANSETATSELDHRADLHALERRLIAHLIETRTTQAELDAALAEETPSGDNQAGQAVRQWRKARAAAQGSLADLRSGLAATSQRQTDLEQAMTKAQRSVEAARLAYRTGTGGFAMLYVAEKAALGLVEARVDARAARAATAIRIWDALGLGWTQADLTPPMPRSDGPEVLVCE